MGSNTQDRAEHLTVATGTSFEVTMAIYHSPDLAGRVEISAAMPLVVASFTSLLMSQNESVAIGNDSPQE